MRSTRFVYAGLLAGFLAFGFGPIPAAQAITCSPSTPSPTTCSDAIAGEVYSGNTPSEFLNGSPFLAKFDVPSDENPGGWSGAYGDYFSISVLTTNSDGDPLTGTWQFDVTGAQTAGLLLVPTMAAIKADGWWLFYDVASGFYAGSWDTSDGTPNTNGQPFGLSHIAFYDGECTNCAPPPGVVPLPGAVWLFGSVLAGGAGFGAWRRRRNKVAA